MDPFCRIEFWMEKPQGRRARPELPRPERVRPELPRPERARPERKAGAQGRSARPGKRHPGQGRGKTLKKE